MEKANVRPRGKQKGTDEECAALIEGSGKNGGEIRGNESGIGRLKGEMTGADGES
jgi:hypothetical protein